MTEEPNTPPTDGQGAPAPTNAEDDKKTITLSQADLDKMIQERLGKARRAWEREAEDKARAEKEKADDEKLQGEEKVKRLHQREVEALTKERDNYARELKIANAKTTLSENGCDPEFASLLIGSTDEETADNIQRFIKMVDKQVGEITKASLHKGSPPAPNGQTPEDALKAEIFKGFGLKP